MLNGATNTLFAFVFGTVIGFIGWNASYVDVPNETILEKRISILPMGIEELQVPFSEIEAIRGEFLRSDDWERVRYHVYAVINDDFVLLRKGPVQPFRPLGEPDPTTVAFAESIGAKTGVGLDLTTDVR